MHNIHYLIGLQLYVQGQNPSIKNTWPREIQSSEGSTVNAKEDMGREAIMYTAVSRNILYLFRKIDAI